MARQTVPGKPVSRRQMLGGVGLRGCSQPRDPLSAWALAAGGCWCRCCRRTLLVPGREGRAVASWRRWPGAGPAARWAETSTPVSPDLGTAAEEAAGEAARAGAGWYLLRVVFSLCF